jgi:hypothetical protein
MVEARRELVELLRKARDLLGLPSKTSLVRLGRMPRPHLQSWTASSHALRLENCLREWT